MSAALESSNLPVPATALFGALSGAPWFEEMGEDSRGLARDILRCIEKIPAYGKPAHKGRVDFNYYCDGQGEPRVVSFNPADIVSAVRAVFSEKAPAYTEIACDVVNAAAAEYLAPAEHRVCAAALVRLDPAAPAAAP